jgi:energy-coupling factor transporter ATP-binding protein EcfA2
VLRQFELSIAHRDELEHFSRQSGGIQQLAMLTLSLQVAASTTDALLLVDEPETSLHPQAQRSFVALVRGLEAQSVIATHSSNVLDLADPRMVLRLKEEEAAIVPRRPTDLSNDEARRLSLLSTPETSESYFSRKTIFVEGTSDRLVLLALARKQGRNLDAEAVSIVVLHGSGQLKTHLKILGPAGLDVNLGGLCDAHDEEAWRNALEDADIGSDLDRQGAEEIGFFVCDPDLEGQLIAAVGEDVVEELIDAEGETAAWEAFQAQPDSQGEGKADLLRAFIHKRKRVMRYSPLIVNRLDETDVPAPIRGVLEHV